MRRKRSSFERELFLFSLKALKESWPQQRDFLHSTRLWILREELVKACGQLYSMSVSTLNIFKQRISNLHFSTFHHAISIVSPELCHIVIKMWTANPIHICILYTHNSRWYYRYVKKRVGNMIDDARWPPRASNEARADVWALLLTQESWAATRAMLPSLSLSLPAFGLLVQMILRP